VEDLIERHPLDRDAVGALMRSVMTHANSTGWHDDGHFSVYVLYEAGDVVTASTLERVMGRMGDPIRGDRYAAQPLLAPRMFSPDRIPAGKFESAADAFYNFAMNAGFADPAKVAAEIGTDKMDGMRSMLQQPGVLGFLACNEAWGVRKLTPMIAALLRTGMDIATIKGSEECRVVVAADLNGHIHEVRQWRDEEKAELDFDVDLCNPVTTGLRILADVAAGHRMAETEEEFDARYHGTCRSSKD
jgi:hypothetical protein